MKKWLSVEDSQAHQRVAVVVVVVAGVVVEVVVCDPVVVGVVVVEDFWWPDEVLGVGRSWARVWSDSQRHPKVLFSLQKMAVMSSKGEIDCLVRLLSRLAVPRTWRSRRVGPDSLRPGLATLDSQAPE